jgi:hypothetical protein
MQDFEKWKDKMLLEAAGAVPSSEDERRRRKAEAEEKIRQEFERSLAKDLDDDRGVSWEAYRAVLHAEEMERMLADVCKARAEKYRRQRNHALAWLIIGVCVGILWAVLSRS